jgi:hypothetical protein
MRNDEFARRFLSMGSKLAASTTAPCVRRSLVDCED